MNNTKETATETAIINKPISMVIEDFKEKMAETINTSGLPIVIVDLVMEKFYNEVHNTAIQISNNEKTEYFKLLSKRTKQDENKMNELK